jgi:Gram-negative bacterial TonB protein C-terminal
VASWYEAEVKVRFLLTLALCSWPALAQSNQEVDSNMSCVERLQMPVYPPLARAARIRGSVTVTVSIAADGSKKTTMSPSAHLLLTAAIETALQASAFRTSCAGKSVTLVFNFVFGSELDQGRLPQRVSFAYPNQFYVSTPPQIIETQP